MQWLRATFEPVVGAPSIEQNVLYKQYTAGCSRHGPKQVLGIVQFFSCVRYDLYISSVNWQAVLIGFIFVGSEQHLVRMLDHFGNKLAVVLNSISKECRLRLRQLMFRVPRRMQPSVPRHQLRFLSKYLALLYWKPNFVLHQKPIIGKKLQSRQVYSLSLGFTAPPNLPFCILLQ